MQRVQQLIVFLLCSFSISAMELIPTNNFSGLEIITNDLLITKICPQFNRQERNALRLTNKKYLEFIPSQDTLNVKYIKAYRENNMPQIIHWRSLGGCFDYQDLANAIKNNKYTLIQRLVGQWGDNIWTMFYCSNLKIAIATNTVREIVPVVKWLLCTAEPNDDDFFNSYKLTKSLVKKYPEVQNIVDLFDEYEIDRELHRQYEKAMARACSGMSIAACYGPTAGYYDF